MRYIVTAIWSILMSFVVSYVLTSMSGEPFNVQLSFILAGIFAVGIIALGDLVLKGPEDVK